MSQLQTQKTALETRRAQQRANVAAAPNDQAAADALRQTESELATVNAQIIRGPGARHVIGAAIGRAAIAAQRKPQGVATLPTPAPLPTVAATPSRPSFVSESDVPWPERNRSAADETRDQNGRRANTPTASAPPTAPPLQAAAPTSATTPDPQAPRRFAFQNESDVPTPQTKPTPAHLIFRANGHR